MLADGWQPVDTGWWRATLPGFRIPGTALTVRVPGDLLPDARVSSGRAARAGAA
jgi:hypothetical protein